MQLIRLMEWKARSGVKWQGAVRVADIFTYWPYPEFQDVKIED